MSDEAVYRTAPTTPGLLNMVQVLMIPDKFQHCKKLANQSYDLDNSEKSGKQITVKICYHPDITKVLNGKMALTNHNDDGYDNDHGDDVDSDDDYNDGDGRYFRRDEREEEAKKARNGKDDSDDEEGRKFIMSFLIQFPHDKDTVYLVSSHHLPSFFCISWTR